MMWIFKNCLVFSIDSIRNTWLKFFLYSQVFSYTSIFKYSQSCIRLSVRKIVRKREMGKNGDDSQRNIISRLFGVHKNIVSLFCSSHSIGIMEWQFFIHYSTCYKSLRVSKINESEVSFFSCIKFDCQKWRNSFKNW